LVLTTRQRIRRGAPSSQVARRARRPLLQRPALLAWTQDPEPLALPNAAEARAEMDVPRSFGALAPRRSCLGRVAEEEAAVVAAAEEEEAAEAAAEAAAAAEVEAA